MLTFLCSLPGCIFLVFSKHIYGFGHKFEMRVIRKVFFKLPLTEGSFFNTTSCLNRCGKRDTYCYSILKTTPPPIPMELWRCTKTWYNGNYGLQWILRKLINVRSYYCEERLSQKKYFLWISIKLCWLKQVFGKTYLAALV